ncbi:LysM peptidoglycan-binding domain-containing protein [Peribacillus acanthi]|uniref:LysM peptidoglycan-binding domain-containing protein n=1 Tax=Peribacillus acanthi TaxID=2171554 RepID=UPI000D3E5413|nr:LysM peptidoglycan-binding domain-containing protein [Peribacillus acanthi]
MNTVTLKRKQRISELRKTKMKARNKKVAAASIAGAITAILFFNGKVGASGTQYTIKKNDNLYSLSKKYRVSVDQLMKVNGLTTDKIVIGQQLLVPTETTVSQTEDYSNVHTVQKGETLSFIAKMYGTSIMELKKENNFQEDRIYPGQKIIVPLENPSNEEEQMYTVFPGDSLWGIAKRFGVKVEDLVKENGLNKEMVLIGQRLSIPGVANYSEATVIGAADSFTVEFEQHGKTFVLTVPYGAASKYQDKSGQKVTVLHKNGAVISVF